ncbi:MAG: hypothetical protein ACI4F6_04870 [Acutalibacteraceae bacterium]
MEDMRKSIPQERILSSAKRMLPYVRQYVVIAIYEVLDKYGAEYEKTDDSTIVSDISVYGNKSRFAIFVKEDETGTVLTVSIVQPYEGLSDNGIQRAINAVADNISQYLENEIIMNSLKS